MSTPRESTPVNGHDSPMGNDDTIEDANGILSESDLSDVQAPDMEVSSASASPVPANPQHATALPRIELSSNPASESSNAGASEDGEFDMEDSPQSAPGVTAHSQATSSNEEGRPPLRRKLGQDAEDDFIRDNPELYGLRRSVRPQLIALDRIDADISIAGPPSATTAGCTLAT
jgi:chromodomain-helicase-DNA-binding protein 1